MLQSRPKAGNVEARAGGLPLRLAAFSRPLEIEGRPKAGGVDSKKKKRKRKEENERRNEGKEKRKTSGHS